MKSRWGFFIEDSPVSCLCMRSKSIFEIELDKRNNMNILTNGNYLR